MEECLRTKRGASVGRKAAAELKLNGMIGELARTKGLSREGLTRARKVQNAGNRVLNDDAAGVQHGPAALEDARAVIPEATRR